MVKPVTGVIMTLYEQGKCLILDRFYQVSQRLEHGKPHQPYWFFRLIDQRKLRLYQPGGAAWCLSR